MGQFCRNECNCIMHVLEEISDEMPPLIKLKNRIIDFISTVFSRLRAKIYKKITSQAQYNNESESEVFKEGDLVEVRAFSEIALTLDNKAKHKGLYFMPEMSSYCSKRFRILKKVERIKIESTGEVKKINVPTYFLKGVYCKGINEGCDRMCFHMWREVWLKKV